MPSLLNSSRPPVFCPGCAHERVVHALDHALTAMGLNGTQVAIVSDIGCSGLFDTFFNTHAFHGLHGRALTYATGIKLARPELTVVVTMGDGGLGIGGAHVLSTCRRNIDVTLLVLNNFNYGMTGGQCSSTTPQDARVESGFLNQLEKPVDICEVAGAAGAAFVARASAYDPDLAQSMQTAIGFEGFSIMDIRGLCTGRYTRRNKMTPKSIEADLLQLPPTEHYTAANARKEYGCAYREAAVRLQPASGPVRIEARHRAPCRERREVVLLGSAGQRILTAGEILCLAGASAGLHATQKNDYPITVMRGHSVSEIILCEHPVDYTGIEAPSVVIALGQEGVARRKQMIAGLDERALVIKAAGIDLPPCRADIHEIDFKAFQIKSQDRALAALAWLARKNEVLTPAMLKTALGLRFNGPVLQAVSQVVEAMGV